LPVEALRIEKETAATLARLGIHFINQLLQLPRSGLTPRLGQPLVRRIEQALGEVDEPIAVYRPPAKHVASHRLEYSTSDQKILADRIERLVKEVRTGLLTCQRGALRMTCRLGLSAHPPLTVEIGLFAPTIDADHLLGLIVNRIETIKLPSPVELLTLSVSLTGPLRSTQTSLFNKRPDQANFSSQQFSTNEISRLVDSLSGRLGCDAVVGVKIKDNPLPEKAFSVVALAGNGGSGNDGSGNDGSGNDGSSVRSHKRVQSSAYFRTSSGSPSPTDAMRRPLSLLSQPVPIAVANENGSFCFTVDSTDPPQRIRIGDAVHSIVRCWGTERIETSWWNGPSIRRDYYRIETDSGRWWWIFRNLVGKTNGSCWMLHGCFN
jgi:protein ImuB